MTAEKTTSTKPATTKEAAPKEEAAPEAEPFEVLSVGTHADPNGGAPIGPDAEPEDQPEAFGLAGATPEETQAAYDEAGVIGGTGAPEEKAEKAEAKPK